VFEVNPHDESLVAFSLDLVGNEEFRMYVLNVSSGELVGHKEGLEGTYYSARWAKVKKSEGTNEKEVYENWLVYNVVDREWGIPRLVYKYCVTGCNGEDGTAKNKNGNLSKESPKGVGMKKFHRLDWEFLVYLEEDPSFTVELESSHDHRFLFLKVYI
jgi:protease II